MESRPFPRSPWPPVSRLGLGCRLLPTVGGHPARIDEAAATRLVHDAIEGGVDYIDTAWSYHEGQAEPFLGRALAQGWRDRVRIATKLPLWLVHSESDWERFVDAQLERLATGHIDFYLLHALSRERMEVVRRLHGLRALERARADGRVAHLGFSFHGAADEFEEVLDGYDWDLCQVPLDFLGGADQLSPGALELAASRRVGVVVMSPFRGGALARPAPVVQEAWAAGHRPWSPAEWALRWLWDRPEVVTVLSSMRDPAHLRENLEAAAGEVPLDGADRNRIALVKETYRTRRRVPCSSCGGCQVCSTRIPVPDLFALYNDALFDSRSAAAEEYRQSFLGTGRGADGCAACGACEPMCPNGIPIPEKLREAHDYLVHG